MILPQHECESCLLRCLPGEGVNKTSLPAQCCLPTLYMQFKETCLCCNNLQMWGLQGALSVSSNIRGAVYKEGEDFPGAEV